LRDLQPRFQQAGVRVACVVMGDARQAEAFASRFGLAGACVPDPLRETWRAMGLGRWRWTEMLRPSRDVIQRYREARRAGCGLNLRGALQRHQDYLLLPGAALVEPGGRILWIHRGQHPGDLPHVREMLAVAERLAR